MATTGLEGKPWYFGAIIGIVLAGGMVAGVHFFPVKQINQEITNAKAELDTLNIKIAEGRAAEQALPQFREEVARLELELQKLRRILPSSKNTDEIIKKIKSLVDQGDFLLKRLVFPELIAAGEGVYSEWNISISVDGRYHDLALLFNRLSNFQRIMNVEQFTITALGNQFDKTTACDFVAKTFVYIEPEAGAGG